MPYLVQRLVKPHDPIFLDEVKMTTNDMCRINGDEFTPEFIKLRMRILGYDYMGSAEFEFGAIGIALRRMIQEHLKDNVILDYIDFGDGYNLYVIIPKNNSDEIKNVIKKLFNPYITQAKSKSDYPTDRIHLKELLMYKNVFMENENDLIGWFCIDETTEFENWYAFTNLLTARKMAYLLGFKWPEVYAFEMKASGRIKNERNSK